MLSRAAKKHNSQALEADALHFGTDIWSSLVVLLGLFCMKAQEWVKGCDFLRYADSVSALIVGAIVVWVSVQMGRRTIGVLLDAAPKGLERQVIKAVEALPGTFNCHKVRIRASGAALFIDLHVLMDGGKSLKEAHKLTDEIELAIQTIAPNADITVHPEPAP